MKNINIEQSDKQIKATGILNKINTKYTPMGMINVDKLVKDILKSLNFEKEDIKDISNSPHIQYELTNEEKQEFLLTINY